MIRHLEFDMFIIYTYDYLDIPFHTCLDPPSSEELVGDVDMLRTEVLADIFT